MNSHGATCRSPLVHPVPRQFARTRRAVTYVANQSKWSVIVEMLFCSLQEPRSPQSMQVIFGNRHSRCIAVRCLAVLLRSGCQARNFFARGQREGREGPLRNRRLRRHTANGCIKCFRQPRTAVSIHRCANPPRSPIQNRGRSGPEEPAQRISVVFVVLRLPPC